MDYYSNKSQLITINCHNYFHRWLIKSLCHQILYKNNLALLGKDLKKSTISVNHKDPTNYNYI